MSQDALAFSALTAGPPYEAEYDALYAALAATERGRWFLTEYANRNRQADSHLVVAAIERIESTIRGDAVPTPSAALSHGLTDIAAAIERLGAAISADGTPASDIGAAVERIQDISFGLRERAVDATLCDALDIAAREISDACDQGGTNGKMPPAAAELLRGLAARVDALIKLSCADEERSEAPDGVANHTLPVVDAVVDQAEPGAAMTAADGGMSPLNLFDMEAEESKELTEAVAALALSLTNAASALDPRGELPALTLRPPEDTAPSEPPADGGQRWHIESPDFFFSPAASESEKEPDESSMDSGQTHTLLPETQLQSGSDNDPDELFEVALARDAAAMVEASAELEATAGVLSPQLRVANGSVPRAAVRPTSLAAMRGLSDDELNALFG